jgi:predicted DNA-binding protein (UPF0251 family)
VSRGAFAEPGSWVAVLIVPDSLAVGSPRSYYAAGVITFREMEALELRFVSGLSWRQVGLVLGIARASARDRVVSGLRKVAAFEGSAL